MIDLFLSKYSPLTYIEKLNEINRVQVGEKKEYKADMIFTAVNVIRENGVEDMVKIMEVLMSTEKSQLRPVLLKMLKDLLK